VTAAGAKPSVPDLNYQVAYQRAFEAVIWSMPAVAIYAFFGRLLTQSRHQANEQQSFKLPKRGSSTSI